MSHAISWDCPSCKRPGKLVPASLGDPAFWICVNTKCHHHAPAPMPDTAAPRREDAAGERLYPKPASAEEAAAFARDLENAPPSTIDDGFDWLDASDAEPILDRELREQFMGQVQAMKTGSPFLKTLVLRYDKTVRALLAEHAAALSTAEREREKLQRIVDLVNAEGSIVRPSTLNRGRVVVVDGRTGLDASEATALEAIAALFEEEDGGESPGRLYITHRVPSGGET